MDTESGTRMVRVGGHRDGEKNSFGDMEALEPVKLFRRALEPALKVFCPVGWGLSRWMRSFAQEFLTGFCSNTLQRIVYI